jgi:hypothetical protein
MPSTLPFINYPIAEYELEYGDLTPMQYGGLHRLNSKQWIMDMKPIPLDKAQWVKTVTGWNESQRKRNIPIIKEYFREHGGGKGYISIFLESEWHTKYDKHITSSEKGKKGAEAKRLQAEKRKSEELTTNVEGTSDTKLILENKESGSVELNQEKKKEDNKKEDNILNSRLSNQAFQPSNGVEKPDEFSYQQFLIEAEELLTTEDLDNFEYWINNNKKTYGWIELIEKELSDGRTTKWILNWLRENSEVIFNYDETEKAWQDD